MIGIAVQAPAAIRAPSPGRCMVWSDHIAKLVRGE